MSRFFIISLLSVSSPCISLNAVLNTDTCVRKGGLIEKKEGNVLQAAAACKRTTRRHCCAHSHCTP